MRASKKTMAAVLIGAVALASGAYAVGSQTGDGSATAAGTTRASEPAHGLRAMRGPRGAAFLEPLADKLGVSVAKLRAAVADARPAARPGPRRFAERKDEFATELAKELSIDAAKVRAALDRLADKARKRHEERRDAFAAALAKRLDLPVEKVREALTSLPRPGGPLPHHGRRGP